MFNDKKILITGGTGTIGTHLVQRLISEKPAIIRILSRDEHKQFELQQDLKDFTNIRFLIGDVRDFNRVTRAMEDIDFVFHLAAMKHVPSCEYNPFEAVQTNVIGTQNVIQASLQNNVKKVLFTSSDKAISPTNTYGATKLTAERLITAAQIQRGPRDTKFMSVRFGNVMGSRGSVIPLFIRQIVEKRKITVTDPSMIRYMMTPTQAISLMLKAYDLAQGGEVFVLKMPIVKLSDLIDVLIDLVCEKYGIKTKIDVEVMGLRPGEKMYEELMSDDELSYCLDEEDMYIVPSKFLKEQERYNIKYSTSAYRNVLLDEPIGKDLLRQWILAEKLV